MKNTDCTVGYSVAKIDMPALVYYLQMSYTFLMQVIDGFSSQLGNRMLGRTFTEMLRNGAYISLKK